MNWKITNTKRLADSDLITEVAYRVFAKDSGLIADHSGKVTLTGDPESPDFIPFKDLTEAQVVQWVKDSVDVEAIEAQVQSALDAKVAKREGRETLSGLPWANRIAKAVLPVLMLLIYSTATMAQSPQPMPPLDVYGNLWTQDSVKAFGGLFYWDGAAWVSPAGAQPLPDHYASAAFGDSTVAVTLAANVPTLMTNATSNLFSADTVLKGFRYSNDSLICEVAGTYLLNGLLTVRMNQTIGQVIAANSYLNSSPIGRVWSRSVIPGFVATSIPMPSYIVDLAVNDVIRVFVTSISATTDVEYINGIITITQLR
jgi:hypothetical protein